MSNFDEETGSVTPDEALVCRALSYLSRTDRAEANARALVKALEENRKTIKALAYLDAEGTNADRENKAYASAEYQQHIVKYENAVADHAYLVNKRKRAELTIEVWRSLNSNKRAGVIT